MRVALIVLLLAVSVAVRADDDEVLDTHPLGEGIPERVQGLEREWADDVGTKEPGDALLDDDDADAPKPSDSGHEDEPEAPKARPVEASPAHAPRPSVLSKPLGDTAHDKRDAGRPASDDTGAAPASSRKPSRAGRPATGEE